MQLKLSFYDWCISILSSKKMSDVNHLSGPLRKRKFPSTGSKGLVDFDPFFVFLCFKGRDPFNQNFRKFRYKTQWISSVQPEKFRKIGSIFWGGPLFPVGPVGILVEWIAPKVRCLRSVGCDQNPTLIFQIFLIDFIPGLQTSKFRWGKNTEDSD